jgi:hypothetical protein
MIRRNVSITGENLPNTFRLKKETINVNPVGTYLILLLQNVTHYNQHHYMTICDKKEEFKTVRYICNTEVNCTRMGFPIPWDTIGNITTINFPERNGSTKFGAAPQAGTLWMHSITIPSFNYTGFNNI